MSKISPVHCKKFERFEKFLKHIGCKYRRTKGDHLIYRCKNIKRPIIFPRVKELPVSVIKNNLRILGIDHDKYLSILIVYRI
jgi:predicted RNA binding protein YcfA (HicA-like mRNA interferase family)